ncbi:ankyrin repeat domain-containing protein [Amycolatopsis suaedae]|uniref:Ankyrin repeat domain-containing protein n=1 Tax=Amycolatopsis suaedae TaxID=2510978 RepID=A0A4Q7J357_9PSEU|nr:ankyrin repeat domain-containing protein [Amycolatopsis suaedae]RZQ60753.1 ankyrin repeat domain-containing protein [Amycolatopsis suaedae]
MAYAVWDGITDPSSLFESDVEQRNALSQAAFSGDWEGVFTHLRRDEGGPNATRLGGRSGYTVLHQAAYHGAPVAVVERLVRAGGFRAIRDNNGDRPIDLASRFRHDHLIDALKPPLRHAVPTKILTALQQGLETLITEDSGFGEVWRDAGMRMPQLEVLTELEDPELWVPVPGMYGGWRLRLLHLEVAAQPMCRVVESYHHYRLRAGGTATVHGPMPRQSNYV